MLGALCASCVAFKPPISIGCPSETLYFNRLEGGPRIEGAESRDFGFEGN